jgi:arylamine N-acetyltransferase
MNDGLSIPESLAARVLDRMSVHLPRARDRDALAALYRGWCTHVPFDNVHKRVFFAHRHVPTLPGAPPAAFFEAWLEMGAGGTCWSTSLALHALATTVGFRATFGVGAMVLGPEPPPLDRMDNHGTVIAWIDDAPFLLDTHILTMEPLLLARDRTTHVSGVSAARSVPGPDGDSFRVWFDPRNGRAEMSCVVARLDVEREYILERHARSETSSPFNLQLYVRRRLRDGMRLHALGKRIDVDATGALQIKLIENRASRDEALVHDFGLAPAIVAMIPDDDPLPAS